MNHKTIIFTEKYFLNFTIKSKKQKINIEMRKIIIENEKIYRG